MNTGTSIVLLVVGSLAGGALAQGQAAPPPRDDTNAAVAADLNAETVKRVEQERDRARREVQRMELDAVHRKLGADGRALAERELMNVYRVARAGVPGGTATRRETVAFCGVGTSEPPPVLAHQLRLTAGVGLVVDHVDAGSPAELAGVKRFDVLTRFNDQVICNADQFRVLVQIRKPSDDVKLALIRQGEPKTVDVELGSREIDVEVGAAGTTDLEVARTVAVPYRTEIRADGNVTVTRSTADAPRGGGAAAFGIGGGKRVASWVDDNQTLRLEADGNDVRLSIADPAGRDVFAGPVATEEQRQALPPGVLQRLNTFEARMPGVAGGRGGPRVLTATGDDVRLIARFERGKAVHLFAFSTGDGRTLFEGPVRSKEQRAALPPAVARELTTLEEKPAEATEFGVVGR